MPSKPPSDKTQAKAVIPPTLSDAHLPYPMQAPLRRGARPLLSWQLGLLAVVFSVVGLSGGCSPRTDPVAQEGPKTKQGLRKGPVKLPLAEKVAAEVPRRKERAPFTNSVGMKFVWIKPGTFRMGSPPGEEGRYDNETPHRVTLTKGYHLGVHLVTQYQWEQVMGREANRSTFKGKDEEEKKQLPVDSVSWEDCQAFCRNLGGREGRRYRLPTEAQWEYACRAGTATAFWWGDSITTDQANYDGNHIYGKDGKKGEYRQKTTPVEHFKPNRWGLYDMHGNLYQWCEDWYGPYGEEYKTDPLKNEKGAADGRVVRGGSWDRIPRYCRAAHRSRGAPGHRFDPFGCRVVLCLD